MGKTVKRPELADIHGVSQVTISTWSQKGMPVLSKDAQGRATSYDATATIEWRIRQEIGRITTGSTGEKLDKNAEEARLRKHQADKAEVEAQKARGEVILIEDNRDILLQVAAVYAAQLDALGGRLANDLAAADSPAEIRKILFDETRRVRSETADQLQSLATGDSWRLGGYSEGETPEDG